METERTRAQPRHNLSAFALASRSLSFHAPGLFARWRLGIVAEVGFFSPQGIVQFKKLGFLRPLFFPFLSELFFRLPIQREYFLRFALLSELFFRLPVWGEYFLGFSLRAVALFLTVSWVFWPDLQAGWLMLNPRLL